MARLLGLDWDHGWLRLVEATVQGGAVTLKQACAWSESVGPNPAQAEEAGRRLRERLKEAGIAPAPVVACVGRDRVIIRDVRYPDVPAAEVPDIVRFQAAKELAFPADETVIDYSLIGVPAPSGEKRALAVILRKELLGAFETMCRVAGLRLEGLTVRPFALLANWQSRATSSGGRDAETRALVVNNEFCVSRGEELLFSRSLPAGDGEESAEGAALPEIRRSLAAFAGQYPKDPVRTLYLGDKDIAGSDGLAVKLRLPVHSYDPAPSGLLNGHAESAGQFAGPIGLVQAMGLRRRLPVDFLHPKQAPKAGPGKKRRIAIFAGAAAVPVLAIVIWYAMAVAARNAEIQSLTERDTELKKQKDDMQKGEFADLEKRYSDISAWADADVSQVDEIYDLFVHFPDVPGVKITGYDWSAYAPDTGSASRNQPIVKPSTAKTKKPIGELTLTLVAETSEALAEVHRALEEAKDHWILEPGAWLENDPGPRQAKVTLKVLHVEPKDYKAVMTPPTNKTSDGSSRGPGGPGNRSRNGFGGPRPGGDGLRPGGNFLRPQGDNP